MVSYFISRTFITVTAGVVLLSFAGGAAAATVSVSGASQLRSALSNANAGDTIVVQDGTYTGDFTLTKSGSASNPITIIAASRGRPVFKDVLFSLDGNYGVLSGMVFENGQVTLGGDNNRLTQTVFRNGRPGGNGSKLSSAVEAEGANNRIDHNTVHNWQRRGLRVRPTGSRTKNNRFDHNHLYNFSRTNSSDNSGEALQSGIGSGDTDKNLGTIFEFNLIESANADGEAISLKSSGNIVRYNTFKNSEGTISNRHGANNKWIGNTIINTKALSLYGDDHEAIGNVIRNSYIIVPRGDITQDEVPQGSGKHPSGRDALVACNKVTNGYIGIGERIPGGGSYSGEPARNTTLANNDAQIKYGDHTGTKNGSYDCSKVQAVEVTKSEVGVGGSRDAIGPTPPDGGIAGTPCHTITSPELAPAGFGVPYSAITTTHELLIAAGCQGNDITVSVGSAQSPLLVYAWPTIHYWLGSTRKTTQLTCAESVSGWCRKEGSATITANQNETWVIGYACQWDGSRWWCGCRTSQCAAANATGSLWQAQLIEKP
jgi:hypothetical protein